MTAIDFVARGAFKSVSATTIAVAVPAAWVPGDLALLHVQQLTNNSAITTPAGWTLQQRVQQSTTHVSAVFTRKLVTGDAGVGSDGNTFNVTVTVATTGKLQGVCSVHRNVDTVTPIDVAVASASGALGIGGSPVHATATTPTHLGRQVALICQDNQGTPGPFVMAPVNYDWNYFASGQWSDMDDAGVFGLYPVYSSVVGFSDYANSDGTMAASFYDIANPLATSPAHSFLSAGGNYIWHVLTLRAADQTATPPVSTSVVTSTPAQTYQLRGLCAQPPHRSHGVLLTLAGRVANDPKIAIQVASPTRQDGGPAETYDDGTYDEGWYSGEQWVDVTAYVRGVNWTAGAEAVGDRDRTGVATFTLSSVDGALSPFAASGIFTNGGVSWLRAGRPIRIVITKNVAGSDSWHPLFTGVVESVEEGFTENADAFVTVTATDTTALLTLANRTAQSPAVAAGASLFVRCVYVLTQSSNGVWPYGFDASFWDVAKAVSAAINATLQATTLDGDPLTELYLAADSDASRILSGPNGAVRIAPIAIGTGLTPRYTLSNNPSGAQLPAADLVPYSSNERILNTAHAARAGGTEQVRVNDASVGRYGELAQGYGFPRNDLVCETDDQVLAILRRMLGAHADDYLGIASVALDADMAPATLFPALIDLAATSLVERYFLNVEWTHPTAHTVFTFAAYVAGMQHGITMEGSQAKWTASIDLSQARARV